MCRQKHPQAQIPPSLLQQNKPLEKKRPEKDCQLTLLGQKKGKPPLQRNTLARPLVIWRESRRVRRLGDLSVGDLLERVQAVAIGVESAHEMHFGGM